MSLFPFFKGIVVGLSIAVPVGPIGLLCIRRTLAEGRLIGLATGLGAATADFIYGCIAAFGVTALTSLLAAGQVWLSMIGGAFLCYLGVKTFLGRPATVAANLTARGMLGAYTSTLFLTLTNPATILMFAAIFAGIGASGANHEYGATGLLVLGVFSGSAVWWLVLSYGVSLTRERVTPRILQWLNWGSGAMIGAFGIAALTVAVRILTRGY